MKKLLNQIYKKCLEFGQQEVMRVIEESIGNNYQGIIWDKIGNSKGKSTGIDWSKV